LRHRLDDHRPGRIDAEATGDFQWIHVIGRAAESSPWRHDRARIPHAVAAREVLRGLSSYALPFCDIGVNYGLNKVGSRTVRVPMPRSEAASSRPRWDEVEGGLQTTFVVTVEIEGQPKPARRRVGGAALLQIAAEQRRSHESRSVQAVRRRKRWSSKMFLR
jgi:acyl dehydratase